MKYTYKNKKIEGKQKRKINKKANKITKLQNL